MRVSVFTRAVPLPVWSCPCHIDKPQGPALVPPASGHFPHCSSLWCSFLVRFTTLSAYLGCCAISVWDPMRSSKGLPLHTFSEKDSDPSGTIKYLVSKWTGHLGTYGTLFSSTKCRPVEQNLPLSFLHLFYNSLLTSTAIGTGDWTMNMSSGGAAV